MQLDPNNTAHKQIKDLSRTDLEDVVAATLHAAGYLVFPDIIIQHENEQIGQIDVFATVQTPLKESRIILECKGGKATPKDILQFASLKKYIKPNPDLAMIIAHNNTAQARINFAEEVGIELLKKSSIVRFILPALGGSGMRPDRIKYLNRYLASIDVQRYLIQQTTNDSNIREQYISLSRILWGIPDPLEQVEESKKRYSGELVKQIALRLNTSYTECLAQAENDVVEATIYLEAIHRIINLYSIVRAALHSQRFLDADEFIEKFGRNLRSAMLQITKTPQFIYGFPSFFQHWVFVWGGFICNEHEKYELEQMAAECGIRIEAVESYFKAIKFTYSGSSGSSLFAKWNNIKILKFVPAAFRALGMRHRKAINDIKYKKMTFFSTEQDQNYDIALNRALKSSGGVESLRF